MGPIPWLIGRCVSVVMFPCIDGSPPMSHGLSMNDTPLSE